MSSENNQQILRVDRETRTPISKVSESRIIKFVRNKVDRCNAIIISDYMKGVLTERVLEDVIQIAREHDVPIIVDPKGDNYEKYRTATVITPDKREVGIASGITIEGEVDLRKAGRKLLGELDTEAILITLGKEGMILLQRDGEVTNIPTKAKEVYDVTGAGDTVVSVLGLGLASGLSFKHAAEIANIAAGIVVSKVGTAAVSAQEILQYSGKHGAHFNNKLRSRKGLKLLAKQEKAKGKTIVFANGCFDFLHAGHIKYLQEAKGFGDILIVGLNSDESVKRLKGKQRPIIHERERAYILSELSCIDYIIVFDEDTPLELIKELQPNTLVKGSDYEIDEVVGREVVESYGGEVKLVDLIEGVSTSRLIKKISEMKNE